MANRLAREPSPYLLQHKDNPVDWYPWGEEAFARARQDDKPIFLSIGYSTCHWCHVMEHESFENLEVASVLNREFVSIKVDREERPDVDRVYMLFVQATTGSGGWPMSVWLTPDLRPFYGGTYYPLTSRWQRPGFIDVLLEIARVWKDERSKVLHSAQTIVARLESMGAQGDALTGVPGVEALDRTEREFSAAFDARRGGFGSAPKFPRPSELLFLMRQHARTGNSAPLDMALVTLRAMALGGMRDHLGGGFHRYSVDGDWRVPHFEKMLYDQAQLVLAYVEAAQATGDLVYLDVGLDTLEYVRRDLTHPGGGFYSAEDADSVPPEDADDPGARKTEGAFYIWRDAEIGEALGEDAAIFRQRYGIRPDGNAPSDPQGEFTGRNLLYTAASLDAVATGAGRPMADVQEALERARLQLFDRRLARPRPHLDDKVLTAWNGLMIAAFARASRMIPREARLPAGPGTGYLEDARRAAAFIHSHLWDASSSSLRRRFRNGDAGVDGYAEDYACLAFGLLELFQADGDPGWLAWAIELHRQLDLRFRDPERGGWFGTAGDDPSVLLRLKEDYDGAEPSAGSIATLNLLTLGHLVADGDAEGTDACAARVAEALASSGTRASQMGRAIPMMMAALATYHAGVSQLVLVGDPAHDDMLALMQTAGARYVPFTVTVLLTPAHRASLARVLPWTATMLMHDGRATAYLCRDFACQAPTTSPDDLRAQLQALRGGDRGRREEH